MRRVYVDHAASTPVHPKAAEAMVEVMQDNFGNPSSIHAYGRKARKRLDSARQQLASTIGAAPDEIVLTSGGTEADNLAILGYAEANKERGNHIITSQIEHHAVLHACEKLEEKGFTVTYLPVDNNGFVRLNDLKEAITDETILITIMHGNNEMGTIEPLEDIASVAKEHEIAFHTDAVQTYGVVSLDVKDIPVTMLSVSSHKINGPKGAGFLFVRHGTKISPSFAGGEQEKKRRPGTENLAAAAGFAEAAKISEENMEDKNEAYRELSNHFLKLLKESHIDFVLNGPENEGRLPHIVNISFPGIKAESFLVNLDFAGIAASSGSACTAGSLEPSHVLEAAYNDTDRTVSSVRFSFGRGNTRDDVEYMANEIEKIIKRLTSV